MTASNPQPASLTPSPTVAEVERISALADPVVRNLQITQCYHELSRAVAQRLPGGANWCTVATWASRQAGQSIRRQDLQAALERLLRESTETAQAAQTLEAQSAVARGDDSGETTESLGGAIAAVWDALNPAAAFRRVSEAVALGNQKVFAEIGLAFARFLALLESGPPDEADLAAFLDNLQPGDPPDGQRYLRQAFSHYYDALHAADEKERAELALLANLEIGLHEQTRLQPEIRAAMDAPIYDPAQLRGRLLLELFPDARSRLRFIVLRLSGRAQTLLAARDRVAAEAQRLGRQVVTEHLMTLELPGGRTLRLGQDLPASIPAVLQSIDNAELRALLAQVDPTPDSQTGTGSRDWSELPDRMHFIADLFRAYHQDAGLYDPPFTDEQVAVLKTGQRPAGV